MYAVAHLISIERIIAQFDLDEITSQLNKPCSQFSALAVIWLPGCCIFQVHILSSSYPFTIHYPSFPLNLPTKLFPLIVPTLLNLQPSFARNHSTCLSLNLFNEYITDIMLCSHPQKLNNVIFNFKTSPKVIALTTRAFYGTSSGV